MSYTGSEEMYNFIGKTSWKKINDGGNFMIRKCLLDKRINSGGAVVIPGGELPQAPNDMERNLLTNN